jgi:hypothetical protein
MKESRSGEGVAPDKGGRPRLGAPASRSEHFQARRYALTTRGTTFNRSTMPARLAERDETLLAFVPQHQSHAPEALK